MRHFPLDKDDAARYNSRVKNVAPPARPTGERVIKRYENRKLYDPAARRYVTLDDLARMVAAGEEVHVQDRRSGQDITTAVLAQALMEAVRDGNLRVPRQVIARLLRLGTAPVAAWTGSASQEAAARARQEAERIVGGLLSRGRLSLEEALALRQEITGTVQRIAGETQAAVEERLRRLVDRTEREDGVSPALQTLKEKLLTFETYLAAPSRNGPPAGSRRRARARRR